jgi:hypothetical protein
MSENDEEEILVTPMDLASAINAYIALDPDNAPVLTAKASVKASVYEAEKGWRTRNIEGGQEFMLKSVRPGKRKDFIITFEPMDTRPYTQMELEDDRIEVLAENVAGYLAESVGYKGQAWKSAKLKFFSDRRREKAEALAAAEAREKKEAERFYSDDPLWGMF